MSEPVQIFISPDYKYAKIYIVSFFSIYKHYICDKYIMNYVFVYDLNKCLKSSFSTITSVFI